MVGVIQEQHADRTRLFMRWKQMNWPIMVDSLNLLAVSVVPITLLIDEHGMIRAIQPHQEDLQRFLKTSFEPPVESVALEDRPSDRAQLEESARQGDPAALRAFGDAVFLWSDAEKIGKAIGAYQNALEKEPGHGPTHFRLGVAYRKRYDSDLRGKGDFRQAIEHWRRALDIDPNQYIWRRRIQQYGPRLDKPYSFYDWIAKAKEEIRGRGDTPTPLRVAPGGAEFAYPVKNFETSRLKREEPDQQGRILRDEEGLIHVETVVVPSTTKSGSSARVHVVLRPNLQKKAHWNNEVDDLVFWVNSPQGWKVNQPYLTVQNPPQTVSQEIRKVEFELKRSPGFTGPVMIAAYALYYVCEDVNGTCLYRRRDIPIQLDAE